MPNHFVFLGGSRVAPKTSNFQRKHRMKKTEEHTMEQLTDLLQDLLSLISSFKSYELRTTVAYILGSGNVSVIASVIFEYLLNSYVSFLANNKEMAEEYDGYMVKTLKDIHTYTLCSENSIRTALERLDGAGLIDYKVGGAYNATRIKITTYAPKKIIDNFTRYIEIRDEIVSNTKDSREEHKQIKKNKEEVKRESKAKAELKKEEKQREKEAKKEEKEKKDGWRNFKKLNENPYDIDHINEVFSVIRDDKERIASCYLVYLFSYYYRLYTGKDYKWDYLKHSIMMEGFRDYYNYENIEICVSLTLRKVLNIKETDLGGKIKMEKLFSEKYNHDYRETDLSNYYADKNGYQGFKFDNILGVSEYSKVEYFEEKTPSYVEDYSTPKRLALFD